MEDIRFNSSEEELSSDISSILDSDDNIFANEMSSSTDTSQDCKWSDSDEAESLVRKKSRTPNWSINPKPIIYNKETRKSTTKLHLKYFRTNNNIKLSKPFLQNGAIIVTTFNDIYIFQDLSTKKYDVLNVSFNITDFTIVADKAILVSQNCGFFKEINLSNSECRDIPLGSTKYFTKIIYETYLYSMGTAFEKRDATNYELIKTFPEDIFDFCICTDRIAVLRKDKTIAFYNIETDSFIEIRKYTDKFFFTRIFCVEDVFLTLMKNGVRVRRDGSLKDIDRFKGEYSCVAHNNENIFLCGENLNELKVIRIKDMKNVTPGIVSKFRVRNVVDMFCVSDSVYFLHKSFVSRIDFFL